MKELEVFPIDWTVAGSREHGRQVRAHRTDARMGSDAEPDVLLEDDGRDVCEPFEPESKAARAIEWGFLIGAAAWLAWMVFGSGFFR